MEEGNSAPIFCVGHAPSEPWVVQLCGHEPAEWWIHDGIRA